MLSLNVSHTQIGDSWIAILSSFLNSSNGVLSIDSHLWREWLWQNSLFIIIQTVIEALKFVTTGITPPGTSGGKNFILDPRLIERPEVVAEVKLNFSDFNGKKFVAGRKVMVSYIRKKGEEKMEFKTIEQTLKTRD